MRPTNLLEGKVVVVSGVGPGLGRHIAEDAARADGDVVEGGEMREQVETLKRHADAAALERGLGR